MKGRVGILNITAENGWFSRLGVGQGG